MNATLNVTGHFTPYDVTGPSHENMLALISQALCVFAKTINRGTTNISKCSVLSDLDILAEILVTLMLFDYGVCENPVVITDVMVSQMALRNVK